MSEILSPRVILVSSLEDAAREMERIGVSPGGVRAMIGKCLSVIIKISGASVPVAHVLKQQMLSIGGDAAVARDVLTHAVDSTDILLMGTHTQMRDLAGKLAWQPFDIPALGESIAAILDKLESKPQEALVARGHTIAVGERVQIMGILNVTPDSFSDGGHYLQPSEALTRAREMVSEGADIVDVGGQSSRPGSTPISEDEEITRVVPVVEALASEWNGPISVDTYRAEVARRALEAGACIVNDITALGADPDMASVVAGGDAACVLMHMRGTPADMQNAPSYTDLMGEITGFLERAVNDAVSAGVREDAIVVDPGIGFGKTASHNLEILRRLTEMSVLGRPVLVGPSRKAFIGKVLDAPVEDRLEGTLAATAFAVVQGARILRVHDVKPVVRAVRMVEACVSTDEQRG